MDTLVDASVADALRTGDGGTVRPYVAACAERAVPLFIGMRAGVPDREADLDLCVEPVCGLWSADRALPDAAERVRALEGFPELQPCAAGPAAQSSNSAAERMLRPPPSGRTSALSSAGPTYR
ncbi:hypothetical protein [Streptomyces sp. NPDC085540]|uniref:hypothetical protein n=1 Tax=Streptomyces sp. NPDC085540 TaxID=3365730 RepID=UPI0037D078FF